MQGDGSQQVVAGPSPAPMIEVTPMSAEPGAA